jgi:glycosyltransferase involved in cell wall biosynthesis
VLSRTALPALWLKFTKGIPYLITEHWSRYLPVNLRKGAFKGIFRKWFTKVAVRNAFAVTTVTENLAAAMQQLGLRNNYIVIPNVADINDFRPLPEKVNGKLKNLVHVSCFDEPAKNIRGIINVVRQLAAERKDFRMEIIGDGRDYKAVKKYAEDSGELNTTIFFTGLLTGDELSSRMRHADAFVMFSNYENLPCTIIESLCSGVPVVSTDVGGISEHISDEFGILIRPGDEAGLKSALVSILNGQHEFNNKKMRAYSEENFSMESVGNRFATVYSRSGKI